MSRIGHLKAQRSLGEHPQERELSSARQLVRSNGELPRLVIPRANRSKELIRPSLDRGIRTASSTDRTPGEQAQHAELGVVLA